MAEKALAAKTSETKRENSANLIKSGHYQSTSPSFDHILFLQKTIGNQAVAKLIKSGTLQAKLRVGRHDDIYEQEAERAAEQVITGMQPNVIQRKPKQKSDAGGSVPESLIKRAGAGTPMKTSTKKALESNMGTDLSGVRVHEGSHAHKAAEALDARAFAYQKEIWLGKGESQNDMRLMAHEAAHVMQQGGGVQRDVVQRAKKTEAPLEKKYSSPKGKGTIDTETKQISIPRLRLPKVRGKVKGAEGVPPIKVGKPLTLPEPKERKTKQRENWEKEVDASTKLSTALAEKLKDAPDMVYGGKKIYYLKLQKEMLFLIGDIPTIKSKILRPFWDGNGKYHSYHVDHMTEIQLGGEDVPENYELLDSGANMSSGSKIHNEIETNIDNLLTEGEGKVFKTKPSVEKARKEYKTITFEKVEDTLSIRGEPKFFWSLKGEKGAKEGEQLEPLNVLNKTWITRYGLQGSSESLMIYTSAAGISFRKIPWGEKKTKSCKNFKFYPNFSVNKIEYEQGKGGKLIGVAFRGNKYLNETTLEPEIKEKDGVDWGGYIDGFAIKQQANSLLKAKGWSDVRIDEVEILDEKGITMKGQILPDIPIFQNLGLDLEIEGNDVSISKTFNTGDFKIPGPIQVTDTSLKVSAGTRGIEAMGLVQFEIKQIGNGELKAYVASDGGLGLKGSFEFDTKLFDPANVAFAYEKNKFSGSGELGIKEGKVTGIKSAVIKASYEEGRLEASGNVKLSIPGVKEGSMSLSYSEAEGLIIGGSFDLSSDIPRLRSGKVEARVRRAPGGEKWSLFAAIEAELDIPGLTAPKFTGSYEDGFFEIGFKGDFKRGLASGTVEAGVTNRGVDENAKPLQGEPSKELLFFGTGSVTLRLSKWLEGTVGIKFDRDGGVSLTGEIRVPQEIELIPDRLTPDFGPIGPKFRVFIPIASVGIAGVEAVIEGHVGVFAKFGAGVLRNVSLTVHYDFDDEEAAWAKGTAQFYMSAEAGLNAGLKVSVGGRVLVIRAGGEIEIGGEIGVKGEAKADLTVNWSRKEGLIIETGLSAIGHPMLKLWVKGRLFVDIDVWIGSLRIWESDDWNIADKELGSSLKFGFEVPPGASTGAKKIIYTEAGGLDLNFDDIERGKVIPSRDEIEGAFKDFVSDLV